MIAECCGIPFSFAADYFFPEIGNIRVQEHFSGHAKIMKEGAVIGHRISLGRSYDEGRAISLSINIQLILQIFLLANPHLGRGQIGISY